MYIAGIPVAFWLVGQDFVASWQRGIKKGNRFINNYFLNLNDILMTGLITCVHNLESNALWLTAMLNISC